MLKWIDPSYVGERVGELIGYYGPLLLFYYLLFLGVKWLILFGLSL